MSDDERGERKRESACVSGLPAGGLGGVWVEENIEFFGKTPYMRVLKQERRVRGLRSEKILDQGLYASAWEMGAKL